MTWPWEWFSISEVQRTFRSYSGDGSCLHRLPQRMALHFYPITEKRTRLVEREIMLAQEKFVKYLDDKGLSLTPQRNIIASTFLEEHDHLSAEDLYSMVSKRDASIGLTTVYRTLRLLVDSGIADSFDVDGGVTVYENIYDHAHHDHLICTECGEKMEVVSPEIEERQEALAAEHGFTLTRHRLLLYGVCGACRKGK